MGTSIVSRLLVEDGLMIGSAVFAGIACVIFLVLTIGFARYRQPSFARTTMAEWSMYFLSLIHI